MDTKEILSFLTALKENNSLEWMHENKARYKKAVAGFEELVQELIFRLSKEDSTIGHLQAKDLTFRLNRDTRFSHDKSPYNPAFRAHISPAGRMPVPVGYYIHVSPETIFLGGGLFASQLPDATARVRDYITAHGEEFETILSAKDFTSNFTLLGEKLKNVPKGYDREHPQGEYLKHKSWDIEYHISDGAFCSGAGFLDTSTEKFLLMRPFNDFLNRALNGFEMPKR